MALRSVASSDTLQTFRTTFNTLATDMGDLQSLNTTTKSSIVAAMNEVLLSTSAFTLRDSTSSVQSIADGDTLNIVGSNGVTAVVSATDTLTISLSGTVSGITSLTSTTLSDGTLSINSGSVTSAVNFTGSGTIQGGTITDGTASLTSGTFSSLVSVDSAAMTINSVNVATQPFAIAQAVALG